MVTKKAKKLYRVDRVTGVRAVREQKAPLSATRGKKPNN